MNRMRTILCTEHQVDENHSILVMSRNHCFEAYLFFQDDHGGESDMHHMFSVPWESCKTYEQFYTMAIDAAPNYYNIVDEV